MCRNVEPLPAPKLCPLKLGKHNPRRGGPLFVTVKQTPPPPTITPHSSPRTPRRVSYISLPPLSTSPGVRCFDQGSGSHGSPDRPPPYPVSGNGALLPSPPPFRPNDGSLNRIREPA
ncbi:hypothetical protein E2C01_063318 [Portunus trituberculatus]|uniref:Uncharacterized protein n=1 Tax=Portunus trituberculatus TaxID=210409 RepID=A0A5B7HG09_PORTR|nr:hypothetical protein [Portunus trituberculatus]